MLFFSYQLGISLHSASQDKAVHLYFFVCCVVAEPYLCHSLDRGVNPDALRLYTNSRGRVFAVEYMVKDARVLVKPFSIPSERLREVSFYALMIQIAVSPILRLSISYGIFIL